MLGNQKAARYTARSLHWETALLSAIRTEFNQQREQLLGAIQTQPIGKAYTRKSWLDDLMDWSNADDSMKQAISPILFSLINETGQDAMSQAGRQPSTFNPFTTAAQSFYKGRSQKIAKDVNDETEKQLRASLSEGFRANETPFELRARIEGVMGAASTYRADRIARTESTRASGFADVEAWTQSGVVEGKEFFCAHDEITCPFCFSLDGKILPLDENFFDKGDALVVGDRRMEFNYDDMPTPPTHPGCRCTLLAVRSS